MASASAGTTISPTASSSPSPQPTTSGQLLFAVLEAKGTGNAMGWNTVAMAGLDGYARAKATFTPLPAPWVGCAGAVLPLSAQVAAGKVYFADGSGTVRSLSVNGQLSVVTMFALTSSQQMLSFAVSPDGSHLLGAIFTIPPKPASGDPCASGAPMFGAGNFTLDVYSASNGGVSKLIDHQVLPTTSTAPVPNVMALLGWDRVGPVGTYPTAWATQGGGPHHYNGFPVRVDAATGKLLNQVSDPSTCSVGDIAVTGDYVCLPASSPASVSVRRPDGGEIWQAAGQSGDSLYLAYLSPDEQRVFALFGSSPQVLGRDGSHTTVRGDLIFDGWLDSATMILGGYGANLEYVSLSSPATTLDLGFKGLFVGTVR